MSFGDFLHRKAEDSAHNEILAFLTVILGTVILIGGLLVTIIAVEQPKWLLFFPYQLPSGPSAFLGLILTLTGFLLTAIGFTMVIYYDRRKSWCMCQIEESTPDQKSAYAKLKLERIRKSLEGYEHKEGNV